MTYLNQSQLESSERQRYLRPLIVSIALSTTAEFIVFVVFGLLLFPEGPWLKKLLWTVVFCGIGMGATTGTFISLFIVDRWQGWRAIVATSVLATIILGVVCDTLCLSLDRQFLYFGGAEDSVLFLGNGILMSAVGGLIVGNLLFTDRGQHLLDRLGLPR